MLLLGYILVTCHKNNIVTLHVTFMLYPRNKTCLLGIYLWNFLPLSEFSFLVSPQYTHVTTIFNSVKIFILFISLSHYKYCSFASLPRGYLVADT